MMEGDLKNDFYKKTSAHGADVRCMLKVSLHMNNYEKRPAKETYSKKKCYNHAGILHPFTLQGKLTWLGREVC